MAASLNPNLLCCPHSSQQEPDLHELTPQGADELHIWLAPLVPSPPPFGANETGSATFPFCGQASRWLQQLGQPLPPQVHDRLARFRHPQAQSQRAAGLSLLCTALERLAHIPPAETLSALSHDASGCPRLHFTPSCSVPESDSWRVSFSYAPGWAVCVLRCLSPDLSSGLSHGLSPDQKPSYLPALGVDLEHTPLQGPPEHFAAVFSPDEQQAIASAFDSEDERVRRWTCKEALLKALGLGFSCDPQTIATHNQICSTLPLISPQAPFPTSQPLHCTRVVASGHPASSALNLFWQCICLAPHLWLTVASFPAWKKTRISFLRLA